MFKRPKRRKSKDNPYTLDFNEQTNSYTIEFYDAKKCFNKIEVTEEIFMIFNKFELEDISIMNEFDNHIEHSEIYEDNFNKRSLNKEISLEELVEKHLLNEKIIEIIKILPEIQQRRLKKYYFLDKTFEEIAQEENCTKRAVKFSVDIAIKKIKKFLNI